MNSEFYIDNEYLGADTEISPEVIDFLSNISETETDEKPIGIHANGLDEYEQAMVA